MGTYPDRGVRRHCSATLTQAMAASPAAQWEEDTSLEESDVGMKLEVESHRLQGK